MAHRTFPIALLALACLLTPSKLSGQVTPVAGPFQISPRSFDIDYPGLSSDFGTHSPTIAARADGSFAVAWHEALFGTWDEGQIAFFDVYIRQVAVDGGPGSLARVFRGSREGDFFSGTAELAGDGLGGFTLLWDVLPSYESEIYFATVSPSRFFPASLSGLVIQGFGSEGVVSPAIAVHSSGAWAAAWERWLDSDGDGNSDQERRHIELGAFHASGEPSSAMIRIQPADPNVVLSAPRVAILDDRFLVIWGASGGPRFPVVQGRLFALNGTALTPVFQIGRLPALPLEFNLIHWDVLTDENRGFWIVWRGRSPQGQPIRITHYSPEGERLETATLGTSSTGWKVHMNRRGDIAFVWTEADGRVLLQVLDRFLVPQGRRQWVTRAGDRPWDGDVAIGDTGRVLVAWVSSRDIHTPDGGTYHPLVGKLWQIEE